MRRLASRTSLAAGVTALVGLFAACGSPTTVTPPPVNNSGPPSLTCPADQTVTAAVGATTATVIYTLPTVTGGTPPVAVTCAPVSGSTFTLGSTTVSCSAQDNIGRSAVCGMAITVKSHTLGLSTVVAFGDSITAGENGLSGSADTIVGTAPCVTGASTLSARQAFPQFIDGANAYPTQLQALFATQFPSQTITVINAGVPGEPSGTGSLRLPGLLSRCKPDTLLLIEGINDLNGNFTTATMNLVVNNLRSDIQAARAAGVSFIFVGTLLPLGTCSQATCRGSKVDNSSIAAANNLIATMVAGQAATLVDVNAAYAANDDSSFSTLIDADGLHPSPAGNALTAKTFLAAILGKVSVQSVHRLSR